MRPALLAAVLTALLAVASLLGLYTWQGLGDVDMGIHGVIALILGVTVSLLLGGGLMFLVFYSSRHGHDDDQYSSPKDD